MLFLVTLLSYLLLLAAAGWLVNRLMAPIFGRSWRLFVAPGVIVHELAHALACLLTGAQIHEINFWKISGGHVIHTQPRLHIVGPVLISFAPVIVMTLALFAILPLFGEALTSIAWTQSVPSSLGQLVVGYLVGLGQALVALKWYTLWPWLLVYAMLNVAVTIAPSRTDLENTKWAFVGLLVLLVLIVRLFAIQVSVNLIWPPIATSLLLLGLAVLASLVVRLLATGLQRTNPPTLSVES